MRIVNQRERPNDNPSISLVGSISVWRGPLNGQVDSVFDFGIQPIDCEQGKAIECPRFLPDLSTVRFRGLAVNFNVKNGRNVAKEGRNP